MYGFKTWDVASGRLVVSPAKAEVSTIESLGAEPMGTESEAVDEEQLDDQRLYFPPAD